MARWRGTKVESIRILRFTEEGRLVDRETLRKPKKRRVSGWARKHERNTRRFHKAMIAFAEERERRHRRSNKKRKNGYLKDWFYNDIRALRKADKHLRKLR